MKHGLLHVFFLLAVAAFAASLGEGSDPVLPEQSDTADIVLRMDTSGMLTPSACSIQERLPVTVLTGGFRPVAFAVPLLAIAAANAYTGSRGHPGHLIIKPKQKHAYGPGHILSGDSDDEHELL